MPLWRGTDVANSAPVYAPAYFNKTPNRTQANLLFGNTTSNGYIRNMTIGVFGVDSGEMRATRTGKVARPAHTGWVIKKTGAGGRANRVQYEVLVAGGITSDAENTAFPSYALVFSTQPSSATVNASSAVANQGFFTVTALSVPAGASVNTYWQLWNGSAFVNCTANATFANVTGNTLVVSANTLAGNTILRAVIASANSVISNNVPSVNATITKTT